MLSALLACDTPWKVRTRIDAIAKDADTLEISPYHSPLLRGPRVKTFDVLSQDALRDAARAANADPHQVAANGRLLAVDSIPRIDFVDADGNLGAACPHAAFDLVVSSHVLEHQPDLVRHLLDVRDVLRPRGLYLAWVPDKRYCFDHWIPKKSIADVVAAHTERRTRHTLKSLLEQKLLIAHNDPRRHWNGDHGECGRPLSRADLDGLVGLVRGGPYIDCHAWQFEDADFTSIVNGLHTLELLPRDFGVRHVWKTARHSHEFAVLFEKT